MKVVQHALKWPNGTNSDVPHEYHEISDDEVPTEKIFDGKSLLDEMDYMFRSITTHTAQNPPQSPDFDHTNKRNEITELASKLQRKNSSDPCSSNSGSVKSKKNKNTGSIKQISHKDEKILNQAIEFANEISARSMTDLFTNEVSNQSSSLSPKRKFSFKFPHLSSSSNASEKDGGSSAGGGNSSNSSTLTHSKERKNFSEELRNVSDLQVCLLFINSVDDGNSK